MSAQPSPTDLTRRSFLATLLRGLLLAGLGGAAAALLGRRRTASRRQVWQLDPEKCIQCGGCAIHCVLQPSAVKCVHTFAACGYCELCTGYFEPEPNALNTGAENQVCPAGAIQRRFVEDPYFEYTIDESLCLGCGKCVQGCRTFGNGSLALQVRHDRCLNCNECSIAVQCPAGAYRRVPADAPYIPRGPRG
jgi:electron transport complex protein RnfB